VDLIIRNARLAEHADAPPLDIGIANGRVVALERGLAADAEMYDAGGMLVCPGLVETHIHIDKSRIIDRCAPQERAKLSPVVGVAPLKTSMSVEDVHARAARTVEECIKHGTTRMRTQVEVDPGIGMRGFEAVQALIAEYKWAIDIEMCVFPQEGLTNYPGTDELLVEALKRGARVIGGAPRYDTDHAGQIRRIFELARDYDTDIDMHLDVGHTPDAMDIHLVRELTEKYRRGGRVVVGHMAKLSLMPPAEVAALARSLADTGIAVTVLPATDLFLMGRDQDHNVRRGVADANFLMQHGVNCSLSSNNILNPATPYGDCSLIRMANLYANVVQLDRPAELRECFRMLTDRSARLLNLQDYGLKVGGAADLVVINAQTPEQAVAEIAQPLAAFKHGRQTMRWSPPELVRPHHLN
jgi:cytosine deaminase